MSFKTPILIFCRIKPHIFNSQDEIQEYRINRGPDKDSLIIASHQVYNVVNHRPDNYHFQFVKVFDQDTSQEVVYETIAQPVVGSALKGYNGTIFAYGQTGSGKTYTISGDKDSQGIVPRALNDIFTAISSTGGEKFDVQMSYLEIYNEHSNDLLVSASEEKKKISLRESGDHVMEWHNLSVCRVQTFSEAMELLTIGDNNRIVGDTPMNVFSSRSHTILTVYLTTRIPDSLEIRRAKLNLVDLAGSERVHKSGEEGLVLEEARHINLSLHYLEQVIVALSDSSRTHVPYRNCTMTSALRDSLGGNCMTVMVANIAVNKTNLEETVSTCRFAQRVALVRNDLVVNTERDLDGENGQLKAEIKYLRDQCCSLQAKVRELERRNESLPPLHTERQQLATLSDSPGGVCIQQLQTDIIYLIGWLQDELKAKHQGRTLGLGDLTSDSVLSTVEPDEGFDNFFTTTKADEDWVKAKEAQQKAADDLTLKVDIINSVHRDILDWWKQHEKSLVREMMGSLSQGSDMQGCDTVDTLLNKHSDLLKDYQLLKSRLKNSKRSLQRIKRKYSVEYNNWKKNEKSSSESLFDKIDISDDLNILEREPNDDFLGTHRQTSEIVISHLLKKNSEKNISHYLNNLRWSDKDLMSEKSFLFCGSDLNTTLCDLNDSNFSTSTLLSDTRLENPVRLARSVPCSLHNGTSFERSDRPLSHGDTRPTPSTFQLTGDHDVDDEIIAFYQNKCLN